MFSKYRLLLFSVAVALLSISCNKIVDIPGPVDTITSSQAFANDEIAAASIRGIYNEMQKGTTGALEFCSGAISIMAGLSSDELLSGNTNDQELQFQNNTLQPINSFISYSFWTPAYRYIYYANAAVEGLQASTGPSSSARNQLIGEAKFLRALVYFHLVNLFGEVPLVLSTEWAEHNLSTKSPVNDIYAQVIEDLQQAVELLPGNVYVNAGERIRANKWAAKALLARVALYREDWQNAATLASEVIGETSLFNLETDPNNVYIINSQEAIWQLQVTDQSYPYTTFEGNALLPYDNNSYPTYYLTPQLLRAFEAGDKRFESWVDSTLSGSYYSYVHRYKQRQGEPGVKSIENYVMLRLAEQYLIRAEAKAHSNDLTGAIDDLNVIRQRAGLGDLPDNLNEDQVFAAIAHERRIELFAEWGHRWLDLKRTGQADAVLSPIKQQWQSFQQLYPIPQSELTIDPNLKQNEGYN